MKYKVGDLVEWLGDRPSVGKVIKLYSDSVAVEWFDDGEISTVFTDNSYLHRYDFQDKINDRLK